MPTAPATPFPKSFEFHLGALDEGDWLEMIFTDGALRFRAGSLPRERAARDILCTADQARWEQFWQDMERIGVWGWKPDYPDPHVLNAED